MIDDPIVDEVRKAGEDYFTQFKFDIRAICDDLRRRSLKSGRKTISFPPRTPSPREVRPKKVG